MLSAVEQKKKLGQFLTPERTAVFMASLFPNGKGHCRLLDAGAGAGSLSAVFLDRWRDGDLHFQSLEVDAFEIDHTLIAQLRQILDRYHCQSDYTYNICTEDFVHTAVAMLMTNLFSESLAGPRYTHAILNPPYKKINSNSSHRLALRRVGIETVNLYSAFVALAVALTVPGGQIVTIIPRSFCNGPYYRSFRNFITKRAAICQIHLFGSRDKVFQNDEVLQENIIIRLERSGQQGEVAVSTSTDDTFSDLATRRHPFQQIVFPSDPEGFIHIPTTSKKSPVEFFPAACCTLLDLGLTVSTGPVVDFRLKAYLRKMPQAEAVPLIYPGHLKASKVVWPLPDAKKPNAIAYNSETAKWLYPNGFYCLVRRFSAKEERRRIVASVVCPFANYSVLGFENHTNLFHQNKQGLSEPLAHGLTVFLNTTVVDQYFRRFSGHTQVNATDLRQMRYPNLNVLILLGNWAMQQDELTQTAIDAQWEAL